MTDKEKMRQLENWLKGQIEETDQRQAKAQEKRLPLKVMREALVGSVYRKVLRRIEEIEKDD